MNNRSLWGQMTEILNFKRHISAERKSCQIECTTTAYLIAVGIQHKQEIEF